MAKKLYVGGLPYETGQQELQDLFAQAGKVDSAIVITDRMTGRSKGFGFVEMSTEEEAKNAITMFDGKEIEGRKIIVNEARPQEPRPSRDGFNRGGGRNW
ncbi:MAG: putative RNA-binding protein RbpA [Candidatus Berkelbacteria bacterium Licking1014_2]|uniref:Putative RNA-binding protein RbpA n=1 Tax=Candidatus Berkelbacteria bacterium Licking1014_2 TaxID=2017146 RepID=A0A554LW83_9BACT|nr:MAG: putative RNA-binding protein RbpA [Candidatus Berkelbacteria bacterium Licking1014_2]